jgi:predicted ester cyclase
MALGPEEVVRTFVEEAFNKGNLDIVDELVAPRMTENEKHDPGHPDGPDGVRRVVSMVREAFPDYHLTIDDLAVAGDIVWARMTGTGTQTGPFFGYPPSGKPATFMALEQLRVVDGQIVEHWACVDMFGALVQLGLLPPPGPMAEA